MKISIIIPTYKPKEYLWECLNSIYNQSLNKSEYEIILILNGCSYPWDSNILNWIKNHSTINITFTQTDVPGVSNARNIGIKQAQGEFITFIDDDDYVSPNYLEGLINSSINNERATVIANSMSFEEEPLCYNENYILRKLYYRLKKSVVPITLYHARSYFNGPCMKLFPYSIIKGNYFDTSFKNSEDALYMYLISKNVKEIILAPEDCVYFRRIRKDSAFNLKKKFSYVVHNQIRFILAILKIYIKNPLKYNFIFTMSRILASLKTLLLQFS